MKHTYLPQIFLLLPRERNLLFSHRNEYTDGCCWISLENTSKPLIGVSLCVCATIGDADGKEHKINSKRLRYIYKFNYNIATEIFTFFSFAIHFFTQPSQCGSDDITVLNKTLQSVYIRLFSFTISHGRLFE